MSYRQAVKLVKNLPDLSVLNEVGIDENDAF